jgi:hypothetical protein
MSALTTRDALAKALWATEKAASAHSDDYGDTFDSEPFREQYEDRADALIASGVVAVLPPKGRADFTGIDGWWARQIADLGAVSDDHS